MIPLLAILVGFGAIAHAQGFVPLTNIPGLTDTASANKLLEEHTFSDFLNALYKYLIGIAAVIAIIQIVRGGIMIATKDSPAAHGNGRELIMHSIFGLILVLSPVLVFSIINKNILNLDANLPPLKLYENFSGNTDPTSANHIFFGTHDCTNNLNCADSCFEKDKQYACYDSSGVISSSISCNVRPNGCPAGQTLRVTCVNVCSTPNTGPVGGGGIGTIDATWTPCIAGNCSSQLSACSTNAPPGYIGSATALCTDASHNLEETPQGVPPLQSCLGSTLEVKCVYFHS